MSTVSSLPRIIEFTGMHDSGPTDGGRDCSICPHCGSKGRYTYFFRCDDGNEYGAMSGCIKLFPVSEIALESKRLVERIAKLRQSYGKSAKLNSWDTKIQLAITAYYNDEATEGDTIRVIRHEKAAMTAYRERKFRR